MTCRSTRNHFLPVTCCQMCECHFFPLWASKGPFSVCLSDEIVVLSQNSEVQPDMARKQCVKQKKGASVQRDYLCFCILLFERRHKGNLSDSHFVGGLQRLGYISLRNCLIFWKLSLLKMKLETGKG